MTYDDAAAALYQAPHDAFVAERKRLAAELKATDKAGATRLAKLTRPPISAWAVNQLWWHARAAFEDLLETGEQLRAGKLQAMTAHREAVAKLRAKAQSILTDAGHATTEATLRRITTTLAAIAATGGFAPDEPGMLSADRDPPGFEAAGIPAGPSADEVAPEPAPPHDTDDELATARAKKRAAEAAAASERAAAAIERRKAEQERARRLQERHRLEAALRTAIGDVERREREVARLGEALAEARPPSRRPARSPTISNRSSPPSRADVSPLITEALRRRSSRPGMVNRMKHFIALTLALAACTSSSPAVHTDSDVSRVVSAEREPLAARTEAIAARRDQMLAYLHDYQVAGRFPTDAHGMPRSVFRDDHGVRCPMAELIHRSGRADLVDAVVAEKNDLRLADVHTGPLADWMATSGLTRDEIIMIQGIARPWENTRFELAGEQRFVLSNTSPQDLARERVRGRLETAEAALRKDSPAAVKALARARPSTTPGPVVPRSVTASAR